MGSKIIFKLKHLHQTYDEHLKNVPALLEAGMSSEVHNNNTVGIHIEPEFDSKGKLLDRLSIEWHFTDHKARTIVVSLPPKCALTALGYEEIDCLLLDILEDSETGKKIAGYKLRITKYIVHEHNVIRLVFNSKDNAEAIDIDLNSFMRIFNLILE